VTAADRVTIQHVNMRHAGNSAAAGAVSNDGFSSWTLQDSRLSDAHASDVGLSGGTKLQVLHNDIGRGGLAGLSGGNVNEGVLVQANRIHDNRTAGFSQNWGAGGLKLAQSQGVVVDGNEADHNDGVGLWCDIGCSNVTFSNNRVHHNAWQGINFEISNGASIHDNVLWENGWSNAFWGWGAGIVISSSANAEVFRNTLAWNYAGISVISQSRSEPQSKNPDGNNVHDNVIVKKTVTGDFSLTYWQNLSLAWLSDSATTTLYDAASNNHGANNRMWFDQPESVSVRYAWITQYKLVADFVSIAGGVGSSYLTTAEMNQALTARAMPLSPEGH
jgi:Right handed beta helix region